MSAPAPAIPTTWSYSRWAKWAQCPLAYKLQFVDKLPTKQSPAMARGDKVHKAIDRHLVGNGPLPPEVVDPFHQRLVAEIKAHSRKLVEQKWGFSANWTATTYFGSTVWLRAVCDVALLYDDDSVEVVDWKTGKRYDSNDEQMELFSLTVFARFGVQARNGVKSRLVYLDAGQEEAHEFRADVVESLKAKWAAKAERMLSDRQWLPRPNDKCKFCDFSRSKGGPCRYG